MLDIIVCLQIYVCRYTPLTRGHSQKGMEDLGNAHSLKYNITSSNQAISITEAPLDPKGIFCTKLLNVLLEIIEKCCHYEYLQIFISQNLACSPNIALFYIRIIVLFYIRNIVLIPGLVVFRKLQSDAVKPDYGSLNSTSIIPHMGTCFL